VIRVLLLNHYRETIDVYLQTWGRTLDSQLRGVSYESLFPSGTIEGGVFFFSDLERLSEPACYRADMLAMAIESAGGRVLNKPSRVRRRYALLRSLHDLERNPFNVFRPSEISDKIRFPVFVRHERSHDGALTPLLKNHDELNRALASLSKPSLVQDFLVVEYVHTADGDGLFRKYSAMLIDKTLIPRHVLFSRDWIDKDSDVVTDELVAEEVRYIAEFPHGRQVREIFELAGIDYGRIDYSMLDGKLVVWEINTNPRIVQSPGRCEPRRLYGQGISAKFVREAFIELAKSKAVTVPLSGCPSIVSRSGISPARRLIFAASRFWKWIGRSEIGQRAIEELTSSIRLGTDQNAQPRRL
jgi:hypothetical protein